MVTAGRPEGQNFSSFLYVKVDLLHRVSQFCVQCRFQKRPWPAIPSPALLQLSFLDFFEILLGCAGVKSFSFKELQELQTPSTAKSSEDSSFTDSCFPLVRLSDSTCCFCYKVSCVLLLLKACFFVTKAANGHHSPFIKQFAKSAKLEFTAVN